MNPRTQRELPAGARFPPGSRCCTHLSKYDTPALAISVTHQQSQHPLAPLTLTFPLTLSPMVPTKFEQEH